MAAFVPIASARRMSWIVEVLDQASRNMVLAKFARASQKGDAVSTPNHPDTDAAKDILSVLCTTTSLRQNFAFYADACAKSTIGRTTID